MRRRIKYRAATPHTSREREEQGDAFAALARMRREKMSASRAAKREGISLKKLVKYVGPALRKRGRRFEATPSDRLLRQPMTALDAKGIRPIVVRGSKAATENARYWNAVDSALKGKRSALKEFRGKKIPYNKLKYLTNLKTLRRLQDAGVLENIKEIYWRGRKR
jgi:hypothetical protein